jgi:hypothetical protein
MQRYLVLMLALSGCSNTLQIDSEMQPYVDRFEIETGTHITDLKTSFGPTERPEEVAYCFLRDYETPEIVFDRAYWNSFTDLQREQVMFHELGHCIFKRLHRDDKRPNSRAPASVMYHKMFDESAYELYHSEYIQELKEGREDG